MRCGGENADGATDCALLIVGTYRLQQVRQRIELARVGIHIEDVAVAVDELVSGEAVHAKEVLDGGLLLSGKVVVYHVVARHLNYKN